MALGAVLFIVLLGAVSAQYNMNNMQTIAEFHIAKHCEDTPRSGIFKICSNSTMHKICIGKTEIVLNPCEDITAPYCYRGECGTHMPDVSCPLPYGTFPSLFTCNEYYICIKNQLSVMSCPKTWVYEPKSMTCVPGSDLTPCRTFDCRGKDKQFATYPDNPKIIAKCVQGVAVELGALIQKTSNP